MTALVFALLPEQVCIAMDTLVISFDDKKPQSFQRKFFALPKLNLVIAGTGLANLVNTWFSLVQTMPEIQDIDHLNQLAPSVLRNASTLCFGSHLTTTTLYHFGYSKIEDQYVGYAYRSSSNWESERLQYALGFKPVVYVAPTDDIKFPEFFISILLEQQRQDQLLPIAEQVGIGGEIEFVVMTDKTIHIETVHRFVSYDSEKQYLEQNKTT